MSAFLGPIHTWLYHKIIFQNELTDKILEEFEEKLTEKKISSFLNRRYGVPEKGILEDIVDQDDIHGWLQERVSQAENRLAGAVTMLLEENPGNYETIINLAYQFGKTKAKKDMTTKEMFDYLNSILLNGMPCDNVNTILSGNEDEIIWEQTIDIHKPYWDMIRGDVMNYYDMRNSLIEGLLAESDISYAETSPYRYMLCKKKEAAG